MTAGTFSQVDDSCIDVKDSNGWTALMTAAEFGCVELVELLLEQGAQVDLADDLGRTALHWACTCEDWSGGCEAVVLLLEHDATTTLRIEPTRDFPEGQARRDRG
jgi:hypothetical protein